ncbi:lysophospholipid transporter LplT, partial [Pseudomonas stutzeri]|nr:lysophospholipid transporter LplT [Stutzerimonas stutzeri]
EQLNILLMVAIYTVLLWFDMPINTIIVLFGLLVAVLMIIFMRWSRRNLSAAPALHEQIGQTGHGQALKTPH